MPGATWARNSSPFSCAFWRGERGDRADDLVEPEVGGFDVELAGLDLGEVEDVVDDRQQRRAGVVDLADVVALLGGERRLEGEVRQADDGVHRRADLVAHVREEHRLHLRWLPRPSPWPNAIPPLHASGR